MPRLIKGNPEKTNPYLGKNSARAERPMKIGTRSNHPELDEDSDVPPWLKKFRKNLRTPELHPRSRASSWEGVPLGKHELAAPVLRPRTHHLEVDRRTSCHRPPAAARFPQVFDATWILQREPHTVYRKRQSRRLDALVRKPLCPRSSSSCVLRYCVAFLGRGSIPDEGGECTGTRVSPRWVTW
jgi:hypothetical protein